MKSTRGGEWKLSRRRELDALRAMISVIRVINAQRHGQMIRVVR